MRVEVVRRWTGENEDEDKVIGAAATRPRAPERRKRSKQSPNDPKDKHTQSKRLTSPSPSKR
jgi:hypothetical protein